MTGEKPIILAALQVHLRKIDGWRFLGTEPNRPDEKNRGGIRNSFPPAYSLI
jgi:hypothetical protein